MIEDIISVSNKIISIILFLVFGLLTMFLISAFSFLFWFTVAVATFFGDSLNSSSYSKSNTFILSDEAATSLSDFIVKLRIVVVLPSSESSSVFLLDIEYNPSFTCKFSKSSPDSTSLILYWSVSNLKLRLFILEW